MSRALTLSIFLGLLTSSTASFAGECSNRSFEDIDQKLMIEMQEVDGGSLDGTLLLESLETTLENPDCRAWMEATPRLNEAYERLQAATRRPLVNDHDLSEARCTNVGATSLIGREKPIQIAIGWCNAMVAARLLSFETGEEINPLPLAVQYHYAARALTGQRAPGPEEDGFSMPQEGGSIAGPIAAAMLPRGRICPASAFTQLDGAPAWPMNWIRIGSFLGRLYDAPTALDVERAVADQDPWLRALAPTSRRLASLQRDRRMRAIADAVCGDPLPMPPNLTVERRNDADLDDDEAPDNPDEVADLVDAGLGRGKPVGISTHVRLPSYGIHMRDIRLAPSMDHGATVLARRYNRERRRCEYLVSDSNVSDCSRVARTFDCDARNGDFWEPRTTLWQTSGSAIYIRDR